MSDFLEVNSFWFIQNLKLKLPHFYCINSVDEIKESFFSPVDLIGHINKALYQILLKCDTSFNWNIILDLIENLK